MGSQLISAVPTFIHRIILKSGFNQNGRKKKGLTAAEIFRLYRCISRLQPYFY